MNLHSGKRKQKKLSRTAPSLANTRGGAGGYGLRERRHSTWLLCDSSDDEYLTPVPKTECQLCFKVFASRGALGMHMRAHTRRERKMVAEEVPRESDGYCDHNSQCPCVYPSDLDVWDGGGECCTCSDDDLRAFWHGHSL